MRELNIVCPLNQTGYGYHAMNLCNALLEKDINITIFPIGPIGIPEQEKKFRRLAALTSQHVGWSHLAPSVRIYHEWDMSMWPLSSGPKIGFPVFELDSIKPMAVQQLSLLDGTVTCSKWGREVLRNNKVKTALDTVVPHGVDTDVFKPVEARDVAVKTIAPYTFMFVGKWERRKAAEDVVKAFKEEFQPREPVRLIMMAWNPFLSKSTMEGIEDDNREIGGRITFAPPVSNQRLVWSSMAQADCFVMPSRAEGWGLPILEAMATGRPVISHNVTGMTEYLTDPLGIMIPEGAKEEAKDGTFFPGGEGNWHRVSVGDIRKSMRKAFELGRINVPENISVARQFSWSQSADALLKAIDEARERKA